MLVASDLVAGNVVSVKLPVTNVSGPSTVEKVYGDGYGHVFLGVRASNGVLFSVKLGFNDPVAVLGKAQVAVFGVKSLTYETPVPVLVA